MIYPKIYLAADNCFAYKRWTRPGDWAKVLSDLGVNYIEASADTELDPLYMGEEYLIRWIKEVKRAQLQTGVKVANLYSGHGTYSTLGITHSDEDVRKRFIEKWFKPMINMAAELNAGLGFYVHAFADFVLQNKSLYDGYTEILLDNLVTLNEYAKEQGCKYLSLEQMYTPHMIPWTIPGTKHIIETVSERTHKAFYFTEDVGHHHTKFRKPDADCIDQYFRNKTESGIWLGTQRAMTLYLGSLAKGKLPVETMNMILAEIEEHKYLFSDTPDSDCYEWLRTLGGYSPIIHLQQTDGFGSKHLPFTHKFNETGIIDGAQILQAVKNFYDSEREMNVDTCDEIYFTLELFSGTTDINHDILDTLQQSVKYWRQFIPIDGMRLDIAVDRLG